ncbi:MAG TPA: phage tail tube protein [Planctomycetota bacterium]|nr:phage tail tube protein [Planctomycetota bacterium]
MSNAVTATGILVKRALLATPTVFTTIGEITEIDPGGMSRNKIETSTHNDGSESHVLGILRQTDPTFKINYVATEATHIAILADIAANTKNQWQILFPSGKTRTGPAYVQMFKFDAAPVDAKQGASLALTWAGTVTEA